MKYFLIVAVFFLMDMAKAQTITVRDVLVSVKADSAASAREQALDQAHSLAFQKLVDEHFPERADSLPSQDVLRDMVSDFSIDQEKTTPQSYRASLTFQFDESQVINWVQQIPYTQPTSQSSHFLHQPYEESGFLKIIATYATHSEWQHIRKALENFPGVQNLSIVTLSPKKASMEITYGGAIDKLEQGLLQKGILLSQQEDSWLASLKGQALH